jgi:uncharacterized protein YoxC
MTKITGISGSNNITPNTNVKAKDGDLFQKTLDNALRIKSEIKAETGKNILGEIRTSTVPVVGEQTQGLNEKANSLLNQLDVFVAELGNPEKSLKDMEPVVKSMKNGADDIMETMKKEGVTDEKVKNIIMESVMTANVEYYKFYRGDYL